MRWIEQCLEHIDRNPELRDSGIRYQSFAAYLVHHTPAAGASQAAQMGRGGLQGDFHARAGTVRVAADRRRIPRRCRTNSSATTIATPIRCSRCRQSQSPFTDISDSGSNSRSTRPANIRACWSASGRRARRRIGHRRQGTGFSSRSETRTARRVTELERQFLAPATAPDSPAAPFYSPHPALVR